MAEYIEREALLDRMNDYCVRNCPDTTYCISCFMTDAKEIVDSQDAEDVRPVVHGEWLEADDGITPYCSVCHMSHKCFNINPDFCPHCGADMRGGE